MFTLGVVDVGSVGVKNTKLYNVLMKPLQGLSHTFG